MAYVIKDKDNHPVTTKDGVSILGMDNHEGLELEDFSDRERSFLAIASQESPDRFKDVISVKGWQLENYRKNPIVTAFHRYDQLPVGRSLEEFAKKRKGVNNLFFRPQFAAYPEPIQMYEMYRDKYLKGFSVGFIPIKEEPIKEEDDEEGKSFFFHEPTRFLEQELLEVACVPIPAHQDCLAEIKGMVQKGQIYIPAKYLQEEQGTEVEVYDKYIHVKFTDEDKFTDLYEVGMTGGITRIFGHQKDEDENELFDYKFIFSKETYSEDQVIDLAEMQSKEKYEAKEFKAYDPGGYSAKEPVIIELLTSLEDKAFSEEEKEKLKGLVIGEDIDFDEAEYIEKDDYIEEDGEGNEVEKPYENEYSCRLQDPGKYDRFARKNCYRKSDGKCIDYVFGIKAGKADVQAMRYKKDVWTKEMEEDEEKSAAKTHCGKAEGTFEASIKESKETFKCECIDCGHKVTSTKHCDSYKCPECGGTMRRQERPGPGKDVDEKGVGGNKNLPLDEGVDWDATAAVGRVRKWAGGPDKEKVSWSKYKQAFVWVVPDEADGYGGYKLPFADVIGGSLKAKWGGVFRAMAAVLGARGGVDLPTADRKKAYNFLVSYYKKFDKPVPDFKDIREDPVVCEILNISEAIVDEIVERMVKAIKGIVRKEKVEEVEDKVIIELEEPEEEETFDLDKDELKEMVSDSFKSVLGQLD